MQFIEVIKARKSIRNYKKQKVEEDLIQQIMKNVIQAPSAGNIQAYCVYIVEDKDVLNRLKKASWWQSFVNQSGLAFIFCALPGKSSEKYGERGSRLYALQDATIAATYCLLSATSLGLASVWVGAFDDEEVAKAINAMPNEIPVAIIPVGYANETPDQPPREPVERLFKRIR